MQSYKTCSVQQAEPTTYGDGAGGPSEGERTDARERVDAIHTHTPIETRHAGTLVRSCITNE